MIEVNYTNKALDLHGYGESKPVKKEPSPSRNLALADRPLTLENLTPDKDLYLLICSFLSRTDLENFSKVCRKFHRILNYNGRLGSLQNLALNCFWTYRCSVWDPGYFASLFKFKKILRELLKSDFKNFIQLTSATSSSIVQNAYATFFRMLINSLVNSGKLKARKEAEAALVSEIGWVLSREIRSIPRNITNSGILYKFMKDCGPFFSPYEANYYQNTFRILINSIRGGEESKAREDDFHLVVEKARAFYSEIISTTEHITNSDIMAELMLHCKALPCEELQQLERVLEDTFSVIWPFLIAFKNYENNMNAAPVIAAPVPIPPVAAPIPIVAPIAPAPAPAPPVAAPIPIVAPIAPAPAASTPNNNYELGMDFYAALMVFVAAIIIGLDIATR